jgi:hypothetical protein
VSNLRRGAGWSSLVARRAHNPKVAGSNPAPATKINRSEATSFDVASSFVIGIVIIRLVREQSRYSYASMARVVPRPLVAGVLDARDTRGPRSVDDPFDSLGAHPDHVRTNANTERCRRGSRDPARLNDRSTRDANCCGIGRAATVPIHPGATQGRAPPSLNSRWTRLQSSPDL